MLPFDEAQANVVASAVRLASEEVALADAHGRVLAGDVLAPLDVPAFDGSTMDGFAVQADTFTGDGPWTFPVDGETTPGETPRPLKTGAVRRIFTGAPLPAGADTVVMQEEVAFDRAEATFTKAPACGRFVRTRGSDLHAGDIALARGIRLNSAKLALAASLDCTQLVVARRPRVAFLATGNEVRGPGEKGAPSSVPDSITLPLSILAKHAGADVVWTARVPDDRAATDAAVAHALQIADVLVTIGGASVGAHDHAKASLEAAGLTIEFWKVKMKPGKPVALGKRGDLRALAIPGNPVSALVTFTLFALPLLRAMQGDAAPLPRLHRVVLRAPIVREPGRLEFVRAAFVEGGVAPLPHQASGALVGIAAADVLIRVEADVAALEIGATVEAHFLAEILA